MTCEIVFAHAAKEHQRAPNDFLLTRAFSHLFSLFLYYRFHSLSDLLGLPQQNDRVRVRVDVNLDRYDTLCFLLIDGEIIRRLSQSSMESEVHSRPVATFQDEVRPNDTTHHAFAPLFLQMKAQLMHQTVKWRSSVHPIPLNHPSMCCACVLC